MTDIEDLAGFEEGRKSMAREVIQLLDDNVRGTRMLVSIYGAEAFEDINNILVAFESLRDDLKELAGL